MAFSYTIRLCLLYLAMSVIAAAQNENPAPQSGDTTQEQPSDTSSEQRTAPSPAFGQNAPILSPENPPISGIDEPRLDLRRAQRSFISAGLSASESADTNPSNQLGSNDAVRSVSHVMGALDLQRFWPKSDFLAEYLGGGAFYTSGLNDVRQLQAVGLLAVTRWRTGEVALHETFNYLPEGSFGGAGFGASPGLGLASGGGLGIPGGSLPGTHSFGGSQFGSVGLVPRITDMTIADVVQSLSPRSAVTLVGGYSMAHYLEMQNFLFNSQQVTAEVGYSHLLNRRDQIGLIYGFREFHFPQSLVEQNGGIVGKIDSHVFVLRWGRTITGRMSLIVGAGPEYLSVYQPGFLGLPSTVDSHWSGAGRAALHYQFPRSSVTASYEKFTSTGSGFYGGADTQVGRLTFARPLRRSLELTADLGYAHNKSLQSAGFFTSSRYYNNGFAGLILHKHIGRTLGMFAAYHFDELSFDVPVCQPGFGCGRITRRQTGTLGVDWHMKPVRIE